MPLMGDQSGLQLCEQQVLEFEIATVGNGTPAANILADRIIITEAGVQVVSHVSLSDMTLEIRQRDTYSNINNGGGGAGWTILDTAPFSLSGVGTSVWRPSGGIEIISIYLDPLTGKQLIQAQVLANATATNWTGFSWMKYIIPQ